MIESIIGLLAYFVWHLCVGATPVQQIVVDGVAIAAVALIIFIVFKIVQQVLNKPIW